MHSRPILQKKTTGYPRLVTAIKLELKKRPLHKHPILCDLKQASEKSVLRNRFSCSLEERLVKALEAQGKSTVGNNQLATSIHWYTYSSHCKDK